VYIRDDRGSLLISSQDDETLANSIKHSTQQGRKEGTKREDPSLSQKNRTQTGSQKGTGTNPVSELPFSKG